MEKTLREAVEAALKEVAFHERLGMPPMITGAEVIRDLRAALDRPDGWISVEDQLPDVKEDVLVWDGEYWTNACYDRRNQQWTVPEDWSPFSVSHWMQIIPPKNRESGA